MQDPVKTKESFLKADFHDALKWLFVGAVTWQAHPLDIDKNYLRATGMFTSLVHARALYEFFYKCDAPNFEAGKDARAKHFVSSWKMHDDPNSLYAKYMGKGKPAQRRVFHLVYGRETTEGGSRDGSGELNSRVLEFATDLKRITEDFAKKLTGTGELDRYRELVECVLAMSLAESSEVAKTYGVPNPL